MIVPKSHCGACIGLTGSHHEVFIWKSNYICPAKGAYRFAFMGCLLLGQLNLRQIKFIVEFVKEFQEQSYVMCSLVNNAQTSLILRPCCIFLGHQTTSFLVNISPILEGIHHVFVNLFNGPAGTCSVHRYMVGRADRTKFTSSYYSKVLVLVY